MSAPEVRVHQWTLGNGAVAGVREGHPTHIFYGEQLDLGSEHLPYIAGKEILSLSHRVEELEEFIADFHPQAVATGEENERLRARLEEAEGLLRRLSDTLAAELQGLGDAYRAALDLKAACDFLGVK